MPDSSSLIGQVISHYRIVEKVGAGGMGEVYRARDERLKRDVALKILPLDSQGGADTEKKLLREARSASALNDPHICTIHEVGEAGGRHFIVMELVEGIPLNSLIPPEGLRPELVVRYGAQIAAALAHAHDRAIIHRDIKTANVVITPSGQVKVLDFGLARFYGDRELADATRSAQSATNAGAVVGTLPYIAPEILRGEEADARSDIWSLGVTLFEMSSGNRPFRGQTGFEVTSEILRQRFRRFRRKFLQDCGRSSSAAWRRSRATATSAQARSAQRSKPFTPRRVPPLRLFLFPRPLQAPQSEAFGFPASSAWLSLPPFYSLPTSVACATRYSVVPRLPAFTLSPCCRSKISPATLNSNISPMA